MARQTLSRISIQLDANTALLQRGMKRAGGIVSGFGGKVKAFGRGLKRVGLVGGLALAGGIAAAGAALTAFVKPQFAAIDNLAKLSDRLGITTESLQAMQLAAELSGVSTAELEKGMVNLLRKVSEANAGMTEAQRPLRNLGLSAAELAEMPVNVQLEKVADAMQGVSSQADKTRIAMELFGRSGSKMLKLLDSDVLRQSREDAEKLGLTLNRVDAAKVEMANDAITRMQALFKAVAQKIAAEVAPIITALVETFIDAASEAGGMGDIITSAMEFVAKAIAKVLDISTGVIGIFKEIQAGIIAIASKAVGVLNKLDNMAGGFFFQGELAGLDTNLLEEAGRVFAEGDKLVRSAFAGEPGQKFLERVEMANQKAKEAADAIGKQEPGLPDRERSRANVGAVQRGTTAAFEAERRGRDHLVEMLKVNQEQLLSVKETNELLSEIEAQFDEGIIDISTRSL